jgi:hypothetical protein
LRKKNPKKKILNEPDPILIVSKALDYQPKKESKLLMEREGSALEVYFIKEIIS